MRKKAEIVSCDAPTCTHYVELEGNSGPADWFRVDLYRTSGQLDNHHFEFCSIRCVRKWAEERAKVIPAVGNHPCGMCDFVSPTVQGLRAHERNAHGINVKNQ